MSWERSLPTERAPRIIGVQQRLDHVEHSGTQSFQWVKCGRITDRQTDSCSKGNLLEKDTSISQPGEESLPRGSSYEAQKCSLVITNTETITDKPVNESGYHKIKAKELQHGIWFTIIPSIKCRSLVYSIRAQTIREGEFRVNKSNDLVVICTKECSISNRWMQHSKAVVETQVGIVAVSETWLTANEEIPEESLGHFHSYTTGLRKDKE